MFKLNLSPSDISILDAALQGLPYRISVELIEKIKSQINDQQAKKAQK